ncbi:hypothetical protein Bealeia2_01936 (plasmid) [Candidatus Bealeia paramacronuclearis]|uniref:hypothetical protein n=1 Tax=Candidatus Bealeia paramacronuclearis TaxID=1921001 RepID=UPI002C2F80ED|nr:hypothetical protein [Candidatus Bealeia paramacronuclearis]
MASRIYPLTSLPGIKKDGTTFASSHYTDGQWCRFQRGLPRKMGGYQEIVSLTRPPSGLLIVPQEESFLVVLGDSHGIQTFTMNGSGLKTSDLKDRTPREFVRSADTLWQFATLLTQSDGTEWLIASGPPNLSSIASSQETPVYIGKLFSQEPLVPLTTVSGKPIVTAGGIVTLGPYLMVFGNGGLVQWSDATDPRVFPDANFAVVTNRKIVKGLPARGGTASPAGLLWSLDSLLRVTFHPDADGKPNFRFDTVTSESSILSSQSVIEYDGLFFWTGVDRFLMYNGVVQEIPNPLNLDWFYVSTHEQGVNMAHRQQVWATKVPQYGEIWWFFPRGSETHVTEAVIFNLREKTWYSCVIPRCCGYFEQVFAHPVWASSVNEGGGYPLWQHEYGWCQLWNNGDQKGIPSHFTTGDLSWCGVGPNGQWMGLDRQVLLSRLEPDFKMTGTLKLEILSRDYAQGLTQTSKHSVIAPQTDKLDLRAQGREMRLRFSCEDVDDTYEMGKILLTLDFGEGRA